MKKVFNTRLGFLIMIMTIQAYAQQTPAPEQSEVISITGATAHIGDGTVLQNATLVFENGLITTLGAGLPAEGRSIDAKGKHIYPGFIATSTPLGLVEVDAVRASDDQKELGQLLPHVRSQIAYNAESKVVESMRPNGVLLGQITPNGNRISGTSSIMQFDGWNWEDATVKADDGIHLHWPNSYLRGRWWMGEDRGYQPNKDYTKEVAEIATFMKNAAAYGRATAKEINQPFAAMQGLFNGSQKLYLYADSEKEIIDAVTTATGGGAQHLVLVGGYHAYKITDFLKENKVAVLVRAPHNLPEYADDDYDLPYKLPVLLAEAGLTVAIQNADEAVFQTRNLPFYAGHIAGQGLDKEKALQMITQNPAKILGIDNQYGTLAVGKSATLFISEGDALEMRGNQLTHAFIDGRELSLETHQTELWKRYMEKYNGK